MPGHDREAKREAQDANPLHKRLPAEIVSRRKRVDVPVEETAVTVTIDRKFVFVMTPEQRVRWLNKALKLGAEGLLRMSDIYDLITSSRFADSVPYKLGRKMDKALRGQLELFSAKQQRFLVTEAEILLKFGRIPRTSEHPASNAEIETASGTTSAVAETAEGAEPRMEEMMARCRAFVREKMQERGEGNAEVGGDGAGGGSGEVGEKEGVVAPSPNAGKIALNGAGVEAPNRLESDSESSCMGARKKKREKEKSKDEDKTRERDKDKDKDKQRKESRKSRSRSRRKMIPRAVSSSMERRKRRKGRSTSSSSSAQTSSGRGKVKDKKRISSKRRARSSSQSSSSSSGLARKRRREEDRRKKRRSPSSSESSRTRNRGKKKSRK